MSKNKWHCKYYYGSAKKSVKHECSRGMRAVNRKLLELIKRGVDPEGLSFPTRRQNVSNWWNWD